MTSTNTTNRHNVALQRHVNSLTLLVHRFAFCEIGKVASSSWRHTLKRAIGDYSKDRWGGTVTRRFNMKKFLSKNYIKFVFVRHPFDRIRSAYKDKFVGKTGYWEEVGFHAETARITGGVYGL